MNNFFHLLQGGDLRSIGRSEEIIKMVNNQRDFDQLFPLLLSDERLTAMRAADVIEKITLVNPEYLQKHKSEIIELSEHTLHKEIKWHLALILSRLSLTEGQLSFVWQRLSGWARDPKESKIVRVNSLQGLFDLSQKKKGFAGDFHNTVAGIRKENIASINARIKKLYAAAG